MKIITLKNKTVNVSLNGYKANVYDERPRSQYHILARKVIGEIFTDYLAEEVFIPGDNFYLDFFLPHRRMVVEVHGEQHYKYNPFFHQTIDHFKRQQLTDKRKRRFCELNNFTYIEFPHYEDEEQWKTRLLQL